MILEHILKVDVCHLHYVVNTILKVNVKRVRIRMVSIWIVIGMGQHLNLEMQAVYKLMIH